MSINDNVNEELTSGALSFLVYTFWKPYFFSISNSFGVVKYDSGR